MKRSKARHCTGSVSTSIMRVLHVVLIVVAAWSATYGQRSLDSKLGMMRPSGNGKTCLLTHNEQLKQGRRISAVDLDEWNGSRQRVVSAVIGKKDPSGCKDLGAGNPMRAYELGLTSDGVPLGIAVLSGVQPKRFGRSVRADVNGDGHLESFRICWSREGAHLTVWAGVPLKSKRLWHTYYYAGYDTRSNCTKKDYH